MIVRTWRGLAANHEAAKAYAVHVENTAFPKMATLEGHISASLVTRSSADGIIVLVTSCWQDMQAIHKFAGEEVETAVVEPHAQDVLDSFDVAVEHFELAVKSGSPGN